MLPGTTRLLAKLSETLAQVSRYRSAVLWILADLFRAFPWKMIGLVGFSVLGAALQGVSLAGAIFFVHTLEQGGSVRLQETEFSLQSPSVFFTGVALLFLALSLSAWLLFMARATLASLIREYHRHAMLRALTAFGAEVPHTVFPRKPSIAFRQITRTVIRDAQRTAMVTRFLGQALPSIVVLLYAVPVIVVLDPLLTLLLALLVLPFLPLFYRANIGAYSSNEMAQRSGPESTRDLIELMRGAKNFRYITRRHRDDLETAFNGGNLKDRTDSLPLYLYSIAQTQFWSNILLGLSVSLVIVSQVPDALAGETAWSALIAYLIFLRLSVSAFRDTMSFSTQFSRSYAYIHRYRTFLKGAEGTAKDQPGRIVIRGRHDGGPSGSLKQVAVDPPSHLALFTDVPVTRFTFPYIVGLGPGVSSGITALPDQCVFVTSRGLPQRDGSVREMLNLAEAFPPHALGEILSPELKHQLSRRFGDSLDRYHSRAQWQDLRPAHRAEIAMLSAALSAKPVAFLDYRILLRLAPDTFARLLGHLQSTKQLLVLIYPYLCLPRLRFRQRFPADYCAIVKPDGNLVALGPKSWFDENMPALEALMREELLEQEPESRTSDASDSGLEDEEGDL
jgi:hypothetical protein